MTILAPDHPTTAPDLAQTADRFAAARATKAAARELYRQSLREENPLTGRELGEMYKLSEKWGQERIKEVRKEARAHIVNYADMPLPPVVFIPEEQPAADVAEPERTEEPTAPECPEPAITSAVEEPAEEPKPRKPLVIWPVLLMILPAAVAIWGGWVGLGQLAGFGPVELLPGIAHLEVNTAITLPIGMEAYSAYALYVWLSGRGDKRTTRYAMVSTFVAQAFGLSGQIVYHLLAAQHMAAAPPWVTAAVACIPVAVVTLAASLAHMVRESRR